MELDTGASVSCISSKNFERLGLAGHDSSNCNVRLCVANGQHVNAYKKATTSVKFGSNSFELPLYVVDSDFPTLLGLEWINVMFGENWLSKMMG